MVFYISERTGGCDQIILLEGFCAKVARPGKYGRIIILTMPCNVVLLWTDCTAAHLIELSLPHTFTVQLNLWAASPQKISDLSQRTSEQEPQHGGT